MLIGIIVFPTGNDTMPVSVGLKLIVMEMKLVYIATVLIGNRVIPIRNCFIYSRKTPNPTAFTIMLIALRCCSTWMNTLPIKNTTVLIVLSLLLIAVKLMPVGTDMKKIRLILALIKN